MIAVVKYGAGNIRSVLSALSRLGYEGIVTDDPDTIRCADKVIFPGVGEASQAMKALREKGLDDVLRSLTQPFLGICLGMQLMCSFSEEGDTECLGIFPNRVRNFRGNIPEDSGLKIPQVGWNDIRSLDPELFAGVPEGSYMYFVHSYFAEINEYTSSVTEYGISFSSSLRKGNFMGCQFHPEKSGDDGEKILSNFLKMKL